MNERCRHIDLIYKARDLAGLGLDKGYDELLYALSDELERLEEQLETTRNILREERRWREEVQEQYEVAKRERDEIGAAFGEPCAECGHIDWRSDGYLEDVEQEWLRLAGVQAARAEELQEQFGVLQEKARRFLVATGGPPEKIEDVGKARRELVDALHASYPAKERD